MSLITWSSEAFTKFQLETLQRFSFHSRQCVQFWGGDCSFSMKSTWETLWAIFAFLFQSAVVPVQEGIHQSATATPEHYTATSKSSNDHVQVTFFLVHSLLYFLLHAFEWGFENPRQSISPRSGSRRTGVVVEETMTTARLNLWMKPFLWVASYSQATDPVKLNACPEAPDDWALFPPC